MRVVTLQLLLKRIIGTMDQGFAPNLSTPYLRSQAIATVSLLANLAERAEEKADLLAPANFEMRILLQEWLELTAGAGGDSQSPGEIGKGLAAAYASLAEENATLRKLLCRAIDSLYQLQDSLDGQRLAALRLRIRTHLRRQLDQDLGLYHPVRAGRMFRGG